jgi:predicted O-linked N-acetylglucosamine transferase (SPINDLY family)
MTGSGPSDAAEKLSRAVAQHQAGNLDNAERLYRELLAHQPADGRILYLLGGLRYQRGDFAGGAELLQGATRAIPHHAAAHATLGMALHRLGRREQALLAYDRAIAVKPDYREALNNRCLVLLEMKRLDEALASVERALAIKPNDAGTLNNRGHVLRELKRPAEALRTLERALALEPRFAEALNNRGNALLDLDRVEEALQSFDAALAARPGYRDALNNRGNALWRLDRLEQALADYDRALEADASYVQAIFNRGNVLRSLGRTEDALAEYDRVLNIDPRYVDALNNRGNALLDLKHHEEALASYDHVLGLEPDYADALNNRGNALRELKRFHEASTSYRRALEIDPDFVGALNNLGDVLFRLGRYEEAAASFSRLLALSPGYRFAKGNLLGCRIHGCDWTDTSALTASIEAALERGECAILPFTFLAVSSSPAAQLQCARVNVASETKASPLPLWTGERYAHERIRIAYLSADFHEHATAYLAAGLFEVHDRRRFDVRAVSFGPDLPSAMRERLRGAFEQFVDVRRDSDREIARMLREWEIDIAVDLKGYTEDCRPGILAHRPAPVQVNYLGYPGTMAVTHIDYIVADQWVIPKHDEQYYVEKVVRLPDTYQPNDDTRSIDERTPSRRQHGLPDAGFVFCCFNNNYKITPGMFSVWMRLLERIGGSVLWLLDSGQGVSQNLRRAAQRRNVAAERLVFAPRTSLGSHLARHRLADLFLDTLPYNAHTTASDALWAGLPVLTCTGGTFAGRVAGSVLRAVGIPEMVTETLEEYQARAFELARNRGKLEEVRARLARNRLSYPLFNCTRLCRHLESAYETMWQRHKSGAAPAGFDVSRYS